MRTKIDVEKLLEECEQAASQGVDQELLWDWGRAWTLMGAQSGEACDYKKALKKFEQADKLGCDLPHFRIDYAEALLSLALLEGEPHYAKQALNISKKAGAAAMAALAHKNIYELTLDSKAYHAADVAFREAILAEPHEVELWQDWGDLHLRQGWISRDPKIIETALEKFTSKASEECDPFHRTGSMSMALAIMGYLLDNLKMMQEAKSRLLSLLDIMPDHPHVCYAAGIVYLVMGKYFSDPSTLAMAMGHFKVGLSGDSRYVENWHGLFQAHQELGMIKQDLHEVEKGIEAIKRLTHLRPQAPLYLNEWGGALMQATRFAPDPILSLVEEAVEHFRAAWEIRKDASTRFNWAGALDLLGGLTQDPTYLEQAIQHYLAVLAEFPRNLQYQYAYGLTLSRYANMTGDVESLERANTLLEPMMKLEPTAEELHCQLGYNYLLLSELTYDQAFSDKSIKLRNRAERILLHAVDIGATEAYYHLACLYALAELEASALLFLGRAANADELPPESVLEEDSWLDNIRETEEFKLLIDRGKQHE